MTRRRSPRSIPFLPPAVLAAGRILAGLSQQELALRASVARVTVQRLETPYSFDAVGDASRAAVMRVLAELGVSITAESGVYSLTLSRSVVPDVADAGAGTDDIQAAKSDSPTAQDLDQRLGEAEKIIAAVRAELAAQTR
jgi:transcriptional regulator with XRE-family HTH domain